MGWLTSAGTMASIIGPYLMSVISTWTPTSSLWPFIFTSVVSFACIPLYLMLDSGSERRSPARPAMAAA